MRISCAKEDGGYVLANGDIQYIGIRGELKHGEQAHCPEDHVHTKDCAQKLLDVKPILSEATENEETGERIPATYGLSPRERMKKWFEDWDAAPEDPDHVALPQKTVKRKNDKGKMVDVSVDDGDLS